MALPTYKKVTRKNIPQLPKGAYVVVIKDAREEKKSWGETKLMIAFDIAEGDLKGFYQKIFDADDNENKVWPYDARFELSIPADGDPEWKWRKWNSFFSDLEDSNAGFAFDGTNLKALRGKLIGGKFANKQSENNGNVYDHIKLLWTCVADDVRNGKPGRMPSDQLVGSKKSGPASGTGTSVPGIDGFVSVPDGQEEELPF